MPAETFDERRLVGVKEERVTNVSSTDYPGHYAGEDHSWNLQNFKKVPSDSKCGRWESNKSFFLCKVEFESKSTEAVSVLCRVRSHWRGSIHSECISKDHAC